MEKRDSFIFYRSFFESIKCLNQRERLKIYDAICEYSLNDDSHKLTGTAEGMFKLILPQLEANRKRFINGSKAKRKQNGSKPEANKNVNKNVNKNGNGDSLPKEESLPSTPLSFNHYMDVLDYLKGRGWRNKSIEISFESIIVKVSTHGKAYNKLTTHDLDRQQETRFLIYLMNNPKEIQ